MKQTLYGERMKTKAAICNHNVLYYYEICEKIETNVTNTDQMSPDCNLAYAYLDQKGLLNESRPHNFAYYPEITK